MSDNEQNPRPSTSSQKPTTSKSGKKRATKKSKKPKPPRSVTPESDTDLEWDFAYSRYLRAIITNQINNEKVQKTISDLEDQLLQQLEVLQLCEDEESRLVNEAKLEEIKQEVRRVYNALKDIHDQVMNLLEEYNVEHNITEETCKIIKNIKPLKDYDEYKKLMDLITKCNESMENFQRLGSHPSEIQLLKANIAEFHRLSQQFEITRQILLEQHQIFAYGFKTKSDQSAENDKLKKS